MFMIMTNVFFLKYYVLYMHYQICHKIKMSLDRNIVICLKYAVIVNNYLLLYILYFRRGPLALYVTNVVS